MTLPSPGILLQSLWLVSRRFPGAMLCALLGTFSVLQVIDNHFPEDDSFYLRNLMVCMLGLTFQTAVVAFSESKNWSVARSIALQGICMVGLIGAWYWLDVKSEGFYYLIQPKFMALVFVGHLAVSFAPYLNASPVRDFWEYNRRLFANIIVGMGYTLILFAGISLAILAIDKLFDVHFESRIYTKLLTVLAGIFNTSYFLYHFPAEYAFQTAGNKAYNWVFRTLCKYILVPIVVIYFLILYAYSAKVGLQWSLPRGWISSLVIGFSVAGIFTYLLSFYLEEEDNSMIVRGFKRFFWWVLLPLTGLLFIAIGKRIGDYGVSEDRFLVAELGVWLAATSLYFLISRRDNLKFIPVSLAVIILHWAFGPWSAISVSIKSQTRHFAEILTRSGRFADGKMKPGTIPVSEKENKQLDSQYSFLYRHHALEDLMPAGQDSNILRNYNDWANWINLKPVTNNDPVRTMDIDASDFQQPTEISGYDLMYTIKEHIPREPQGPLPLNTFILSEDGHYLEEWQQTTGKEIRLATYSLDAILQKWWVTRDGTPMQDKNSLLFNQQSLPSEKRRFILNGPTRSVLLIIDYASISLSKDRPQFSSLNGKVLVKNK